MSISSDGSYRIGPGGSGTPSPGPDCSSCRGGISEQGTVSGEQEYIDIGVPKEWVPVLQKLGYTTIEKLKSVKKPGKLANDLNGYKKKNKLDLPGLSPETVAEWLKSL